MQSSKKLGGKSKRRKTEVTVVQHVTRKKEGIDGIIKQKTEQRKVKKERNNQIKKEGNKEIGYKQR